MENLILSDIKLDFYDEEDNELQNEQKNKEIIEIIKANTNYELLEKFYINHRNIEQFTKSEMELLINDLNFLDSKSLFGVIIIAKDKYPNITLIPDLEKFYNSANLGYNIFISMCGYGTPRLIGSYLIESQINKGLEMAVSCANFTNIDFLIELGANPNTRYVINAIANNGNVKVAKHLMKLGLQIHSNHEFVFSMACKNGYFEMAKFLLEDGVDMDLIGEVAIMLASRNGHLKIINLFLVYGINEQLKNKALLESCENDHLEIVKLLVQNGANVHYLEERPLIVASSNGHADIVEYLISEKANIFQLKNAAFKRAVEKGHVNVASILIKNGVNINYLNTSKILYSACENNRLEMVKFLLSKVYYTFDELDYASLIAEQRGYIEIYNYIVEQMNNM